VIRKVWKRTEEKDRQIEAGGPVCGRECPPEMLPRRAMTMVLRISNVESGIRRGVRGARKREEERLRRRTKR